MDGHGRTFNSTIVERLWRTVKYEEAYLKAYEDGLGTFERLDKYFFYINDRQHQSLECYIPYEVHHGLRKGNEREIFDGGLCPPNPPAKKKTFPSASLKLRILDVVFFSFVLPFILPKRRHSQAPTERRGVTDVVFNQRGFAPLVF